MPVNRDADRSNQDRNLAVARAASTHRDLANSLPLDGRSLNDRSYYKASEPIMQFNGRQWFSIADPEEDGELKPAISNGCFQKKNPAVKPGRILVVGRG
jgi:hypothetical protein